MCAEPQTRREITLNPTRGNRQPGSGGVHHVEGWHIGHILNGRKNSLHSIPPSYGIGIEAISGKPTAVKSEPHRSAFTITPATYVFVANWLSVRLLLGGGFGSWSGAGSGPGLLTLTPAIEAPDRHAGASSRRLPCRLRCGDCCCGDRQSLAQRREQVTRAFSLQRCAVGVAQRLGKVRQLRQKRPVGEPEAPATEQRTSDGPSSANGHRHAWGRGSADLRGACERPRSRGERACTRFGAERPRREHCRGLTRDTNPAAQIVGRHLSQLFAQLRELDRASLRNLGRDRLTRQPARDVGSMGRRLPSKHRARQSVSIPSGAGGGSARG